MTSETLPKKLVQILEKGKLIVQKIVIPSYLQWVTTKTFTPLNEWFSKLVIHNHITTKGDPVHK
jgi:hypothetical protein